MICFLVSLELKLFLFLKGDILLIFVLLLIKGAYIFLFPQQSDIYLGNNWGFSNFNVHMITGDLFKMWIMTH